MTKMPLLRDCEPSASLALALCCTHLPAGLILSCYSLKQGRCMQHFTHSHPKHASRTTGLECMPIKHVAHAIEIQTAMS